MPTGFDMIGSGVGNGGAIPVDARDPLALTSAVVLFQYQLVWAMLLGAIQAICRRSTC